MGMQMGRSFARGLILGRRNVRTRLLSVFQAFGVLLATMAWPHLANAENFDQKYIEPINKSSGITPLAVDSFGDRIDIANGSVTFNWTDIDIPGNNSLPVRLQRQFQVHDASTAWTGPGMFAFGDIDVPYLYGVFSDFGWQVNATDPNSRCTNGDMSPPAFSGGVLQASDYWSGNTLHVPWEGNQTMLKLLDAKEPKPTGVTPKIMTKNHWYFLCEPTTKNGYPGEGFIAVSPKGEKYYFDWVIERGYTHLSKRYGNYGGSPGPSVATMNRKIVYFLATRIEDRFGNWVNYSYAGNKLNQITSSDGRFITITSWNGDKIATVSSSIGQWSYGYGTNTMTVTQPDGGKWTLSSTGIPFLTPTPDPPVYQGTPVCPAPEQSEGTFQMVVTQPSGASATYDFSAMRHNKTNVPKLCNAFIDGSLTSYQYLTIPNFSDTLTLTSKTIVGAGLPSLQWTYTYNETGLLAFEEQCQDTTPKLCPKSKTVIVRGPDRSYQAYQFGIMFGINTGQLLQEQDGYESGSTTSPTVNILKTIQNTYYDPFEDGPQVFADEVGSPGSSRFDAAEMSMTRPLVRRVVIQDGTAFQWFVNKNGSTGQYLFDAFANPTSVTKQSGPYVVPPAPPSSAPTISAPSQSGTGNYTVSWTSVSGATSYKLDEKGSSGSWARVYSGTATSFAITGRATGTYAYRVSACNAGGCSPPCAGITVVVNTSSLAAPTLTMATTSTSPSFYVTWTSVSGATSYKLDQSTDGGQTWSASPIYSGSATSFQQTNQPNQTTYYYRVRACNASGCSFYSATRSVSIEWDPCPTCRGVGGDFRFEPMRQVATNAH